MNTLHQLVFGIALKRGQRVSRGQRQGLEAGLDLGERRGTVHLRLTCS